MGGPRMGAEHMNDAQMGERHRSRQFERMLRLYDTDGDGKISLAEINADQARMFTALDVNGDKSMSVEEIRRRGRALQIFRTTTLFDLLDVDGDGKLSLAEIQGPSRRWFKRYDNPGRRGTRRGRPSFRPRRLASLGRRTVHVDDGPFVAASLISATQRPERREGVGRLPPCSSRDRQQG